MNCIIVPLIQGNMVYIHTLLHHCLPPNTLHQRECQWLYFSSGWTELQNSAGHNAGILSYHIINIKILNWRDLQLWLRNKNPILELDSLSGLLPNPRKELIAAECRGIIIILPSISIHQTSVSFWYPIISLIIDINILYIYIYIYIYIFLLCMCMSLNYS